MCDRSTAEASSGVGNERESGASTGPASSGLLTEPGSLLVRPSVLPRELRAEPTSMMDTYHLSRDQNFGVTYDVIAAVEAEVSAGMQNCMYMAPYEHASMYTRIMELCGRFRQAVTCSSRDDIRIPPCPTSSVSSSATPARSAFPVSSSVAPARPDFTDAPSTPPTRSIFLDSSSAQVTRPEFEVSTCTPRPAAPYSTGWDPYGTRPISFGYEAGSSSLAPGVEFGGGSSSRGPLRHSIEYQHHGMTDDDETEDEIETEATWFVSSFFAYPTQDEMGASQLGDTPVDPTQVSQEPGETPVPGVARRLPRQVVPPSPITYSQQHTRAAQDALRRRRRGGGAALRGKRGRRI